MKRSTLTFVAVAAFALACSDKLPEKNATPKAPDTPFAPAVAPAPQAAASSICRVYQQELESVRDQAKNSATPTEIEAHAAVLAAITADVCN